MTSWRRIRPVAASTAAVIFLAIGAARFVGAGLLPATRGFRGDFGASFPTAYFARLRPDVPTDQVWTGWNYGPMLHFLTAPLLLVPRWSLAPPLWASINLLALAVSFFCVIRLEPARRPSWPALLTLGGLWLLYQPLATSFAQGNIEILEMAMVLTALVWLPRWKGIVSGMLVGVAAMSKFLPIGFLFWFLIRRYRTAFLSGLVTVAVIIAVTSVTLGWNNSISLNAMTWAADAPIAGLHELSVTSFFLHRASLLDYSVPVIRWFPTARATLAGNAGGLTSALLALVFAAALFRRRRQPVSSAEIAVLFMTMFMILPWNHDYYYVFGLVTLSALFLRAVATRNRLLLAITLLAYICISPPFPYSLIDRMGLFALPFAYVLNYHDVPVLGGLLLWGAAAQQMFDEPWAAPVARQRPRSRRVFAVGALALLCVAALALWRIRRVHPEALSRSTIELPAFLTGPNALALSPDETRIAYLSTTPTGWHLCAAPVDGAAGTCFEQTAGAEGPFFSPHGDWIGFFAGTELRKVAIATGMVTTIASAPGASGGTWDDDDTILFASTEGIVRAKASGGSRDILIASEYGKLFSSPSLVRSGKAVLFATTPAGADSNQTVIVVQSLNDGRRVRLLFGDEPHFDRSTGSLIYTWSGRLLAAPVDNSTFMPVDVAVTLAANTVSSAGGGTQFAVGARGSVVFGAATGTPVVRRSLVWVDRNGRPTSLPIPANAFETPRLSPDGRSLAVTIRDVVSDVWVFDVLSGDLSRLTLRGYRNETPVWLADDTLSFSVPAPHPVIYSARLREDRSKDIPLWIGRQAPPVLLSSSSPNGRLIAGTQAGHLWTLDLDRAMDDAARTVVGKTRATEMNPAFSADSRYLAYTSDTSGRTEVYVRPVDTDQGAIQISVAGGEEPRWRGDGRELFYRRGDALMSVEIIRGPMALTAGTPRALFQDAYLKADGRTNYDVTPDGRRFLMVRAEPTAPMRIELLRGWTAMLPH